VSTETEVSGSIEMYLAAIATRQRDEQPVPLSQLADALSHSAVSVNEMCRKLVERGWATYQPYKGVTLTSEGMLLAEQVLCRRRLWQVFLVERLGADPMEAEAFACQLEHATPGDLARRLAAFLAYPDRSPGDEPIPCAFAAGASRPVATLASLAVGQRAQVVEITMDGVVQQYLNAQGVVAGAAVEVLAVSSDGVLLIENARGQLSVCRSLAERVTVELNCDVPSVTPHEVSR
jgi:DtxR family Mn-dependent transcriptional regulator